VFGTPACRPYIVTEELNFSLFGTTLKISIEIKK